MDVLEDSVELSDALRDLRFLSFPERLDFLDFLPRFPYFQSPF